MTNTTTSLTPSHISSLVGRHAEVELLVADEHTAPHVGSGSVRVLATPVLVNLLEAAALAAAEAQIPAGQQTVGIHLDVRHFAATPVGMRVTAHAEVIAVTLAEGAKSNPNTIRNIRFRVWAEDEVEAIASGEHERVAITLAKFDARMDAKRQRRKPSVKA